MTEGRGHLGAWEFQSSDSLILKLSCPNAVVDLLVYHLEILLIFEVLHTQKKLDFYLQGDVILQFEESLNKI